MEAALETSREAGAHHAGCGRRCGYALVAPGRSNPQGAAAMLPAARSHSASYTLSFRGRRSPHVRKHRNPQHRITQFLPPSQQPFPVSQARQGAGWMPVHRARVQLVLLMVLAALFLPLNQLGLLQWQKGVNGCRHVPSAHSSCPSNSHNSSFAHRALLTSQMRSPPPLSHNQRRPAPHVSVSHRQLLPCLTSCGLPKKPVAYPMALQETAMRSWNESSSPLARQRTAAGGTTSRERRKGCCSWRLRPRDGWQDGPSPDSLSTSLSSTKKTQWVGWTVNSTEWELHQEMAPRSVQCRLSPCSGNSLAQGRCGSRGVVDAMARMAGVHCASALPVAAAWRVGFHQADGAQQRKRGGHGCSGVAAWTGDAARWCRRQGYRALQRACACVLPQRHCARRGVGFLSVHAHRSRAHPRKLANPQHEWPASRLLEVSAWVRAVGGFVVAPQLATVTPSHRVIDFFVVPETSQARVKLPRISLTTSHPTGPSEFSCPRV